MTAGLGQRLRPFTQLKTKALLPIMGVPAAQYSIDSFLNAGVEKVIANVHHLASDTFVGLSALDHSSCELILTDESQCLLGTAGGIKNALSHLGEGPFFRSNADVICEIDWKSLEEAHSILKEKNGVVLTLALSSGVSREAYAEILFDSKTELMVGIGTAQKSKPFWTGAAVIEPEAMKSVTQSGPSDFVTEVLLPAVEQKKVGVYLTSGFWFDIGSPALWLDTHMRMIRELELDDSKFWMKRVVEINRRIDFQQWAHHTIPLELMRIDRKLNGPCYWGLGDDSNVNSLTDFKELGPNVVLYEGGIQDEERILRDGIKFGGHWIPVVDK